MDTFSPSQRSEIMRKVKSKNTKPELLVRSLVHRLGFRFRLHRRDLPGCPDLVFPARSRVIFVHGCFFHGHHCRAAALPKSNQNYWAEKLRRNVQRDQQSIRSLRRQGWRVMVVWECQLKQTGKLSSRLTRYLSGGVRL